MRYINVVEAKPKMVLIHFKLLWIFTKLTAEKRTSVNKESHWLQVSATKLF